MYQNKRITVIIAAAGSGKRMGGGISKQYMEIDGEMILERSLRAFCVHPYIDRICLTVRAEDLAFCKDRWFSKPGYEKLTMIIPGGNERQDSVTAALNAIEAEKKARTMFWYTTARDRLLLPDEISRIDRSRCINTAPLSPGVAVKDTIKKAEDGLSYTETPGPQDAVRDPDAAGICVRSARKRHTDKAAAGWISAGQMMRSLLNAFWGKGTSGKRRVYSNRKITTKEDLGCFEREWRIGTGTDIHAFENGSKARAWRRGDSL